MSRYSRQEAFYGVGQKGQERLANSRIVIIGMGALGSVSAEIMARAGVGFIRIVDRDYVELSNLQRQLLYTENDAKEALPKVIAAAEHLRQINSEIIIEPVITDFNSSTAEALIADVDLVLDATDNFEARYLINEVCRHLKKDWIYGGALGSSGMTYNFIYGDDSPCLCCLMPPSADDGKGRNCVTDGVLAPVTAVTASVQCTEAVKILTRSGDVRKTLFSFDLWDNNTQEFVIEKNPDCPVCVHKTYTYFGSKRGMEAVSLCGRNQVQVVPEHPLTIDFEDYSRRLSPLGTVQYTRFTLDFKTESFAIKLFRNGRAIISGTDDVSRAKSIYTEYIGG